MQRAFAREMRLEEFHLVGQYPASLQVDVFGVGRYEGNRQELDTRLFGRAAGLVVVAALAGRDHVVPGVGAALAQWGDVVARQIVRVKCCRSTGKDWRRGGTARDC